jgi:hypothetical protein
MSAAAGSHSARALVGVSIEEGGITEHEKTGCFSVPGRLTGRRIPITNTIKNVRLIWVLQWEVDMTLVKKTP